MIWIEDVRDATPEEIKENAPRSGNSEEGKRNINTRLYYKGREGGKSR